MLPGQWVVCFLQQCSCICSWVILSCCLCRISLHMCLLSQFLSWPWQNFLVPARQLILHTICLVVCEWAAQERKAAEEKRRRVSFFFIRRMALGRSARRDPPAGTPGGPASWCVLHRRPAIHFPRLWFMDCRVGVGARVCVFGGTELFSRLS